MDRSGAVVQDIVCVRDLSYTGLVWQLVGPFCFITRMTSGSEELVEHGVDVGAADGSEKRCHPDASCN